MDARYVLAALGGCLTVMWEVLFPVQQARGQDQVARSVRAFWHRNLSRFPPPEEVRFPIARCMLAHDVLQAIPLFCVAVIVCCKRQLCIIWARSATAAEGLYIRTPACAFRGGSINRPTNYQPTN
jgi:hypothetical protein